MKKNLAKKITLSILAGAMLMSNSVAWAETTVNAKDNTSKTNAWTGIVVNSVDGYSDASGSSTGAIAIGSGASTNGGFGTVVGAGAKSVGQEASAFGYNAQGGAGQATALGAGAKANSFGSVALYSATYLSYPNFKITDMKNGTSKNNINPKLVTDEMIANKLIVIAKNNLGLFFNFLEKLVTILWYTPVLFNTR